MGQVIKVGSEAWHAERRTGIGGSDAPIALGMSKWKTPHQLYQEKIGEAEPDDETWEMMRGHAMEPCMRQWYANTTGRSVVIPHRSVVHPKYDWMRYNADGLTDDRLQEFKTNTYGQHWGEEGSDAIPEDYLIQVQHGMAVTNRPVADVMVSIAGNKPKLFEVIADAELQEMIIEQEAAFWEKVQSRTPPDPVNNEDVARIYKKVNGCSIAASDEIAEAFQLLKDVRAKMKEGDATKEELEVIIKHFMGENEVLVDASGKPMATWKQQKGSRRIDAEALRDNFPEVAEQVTTIGDPLRRFLVK